MVVAPLAAALLTAFAPGWTLAQTTAYELHMFPRSEQGRLWSLTLPSALAFAAGR